MIKNLSQFNQKNQKKHDAVWSEWSEWSTCSRSCDGGVSSRGRHCFASSDLATKVSCEKENSDSGTTTNDREHKICNTQPCTLMTSKLPMESFRAQQCSQYNNVPYKVIIYYHCTIFA